MGKAPREVWQTGHYGVWRIALLSDCFAGARARGAWNGPRETVFVRPPCRSQKKAGPASRSFPPLPPELTLPMSSLMKKPPRIKFGSMVRVWLLGVVMGVGGGEFFSSG